MFAPRPSIWFQKIIEMCFFPPTPSIFFVSRIFPKNVKLQPSFCPCISAGIGSIGNVTPHGVRKSYHCDGTIDIGRRPSSLPSPSAGLKELILGGVASTVENWYADPVKRAIEFPLASSICRVFFKLCLSLFN